jgi:phage shock protein PspC (stress-responsive transcriptional regulator)
MTSSPEQTSYQTTDQSPAPEAPKRLTRSADDKFLGGVCGGVAEYFGVDANVVRLLTVLGTVLGFGVLVFVYVAAWLILSEA